MNNVSPAIFILSGESGTGKTSLCLRTVTLLRQAGMQPAGLVSPAQFDGTRKTGILVRDIRSGEQRRLAEPEPRRERAGLGWRFDPATLRWGSEILQSGATCDVLVVDEVGPLEVHQGKGWMAVWKVLELRKYRAALIVVRPSLLGSVKERLHGRHLEVVNAIPSLPTAESLSESIRLSVVRTTR